ncbi:MAG: glycosyltransferase family 2 protein [Candidatus Roizmanbacteria bacterium]
MIQIVHSDWFRKLGEILLPLLTWLLITFPIWMSPFHPAVVAYFIIAFNVYFLYKAFTTSVNATLAFRNILFHQKIPYIKKIKNLKNIEKINHFIIIPNYKEPLYKLEETIDRILSNDYNMGNMHLVLAFEKREIEAIEKETYFRKKYKNKFTDIISSYHVLVAGEAPGKASNQTFAAKIIDRYALKKEMDPDFTILTICDADSLLPDNFFSYLTYEFLKDPDRRFHFYWAPVLLYNNFWQLPFFVRMQATMSSILRLAFLSQKEELIQVSTYSTNLWLLKSLNFWDVDIIPEDWHIHLQAFFTYGEKVRTIALYTIVNGDAVFAGTFLKTLSNRYEQEKRWAWGATDVAYAWHKLFTTPHIHWFPKVKKILFLAETHLLWPTSFFMLTLSASVPPLINSNFKRTVLGFILPQMSGFILTISTLLLAIYIYLDIKLREEVKIKTHPSSLPLLLIQWYLMPVVSFLLSSLPALDAHTRMLLGKKIIYKVTEKV